MSAEPAIASVEFENSYAEALEELVVLWQPDHVDAPDMIALNRALAAELGLGFGDETLTELVAGNSGPPAAVSMAYAGHQFGGYSPRLGDGRAVLLGELFDRQGNRLDLHLKGSGRTPYARGGDGKAELGPMLREYLIAEAMHALGVPTGRALGVVATGEQVHRQGLVPGGVLARVAASHLRVGTFEYAARLPDVPDLLQRLVDYTIARHYPEAATAANQALALLEAVIDAQASLIAHWMLTGFIHGVMNTDNMTISGETIDYGPCAFLDSYDPNTVYSSIDHQGRYAYGNQPGIAQWNLTRLAETLLPMLDDDGEAAVALATEALQQFPKQFHRYWAQGMASKLGLTEVDAELFGRFVELLEAAKPDYTTTFRNLSRHLRGDQQPLASQFADNDETLSDWLTDWQTAIEASERTALETAVAMDETNPVYVPRNHLVEEALQAATEGDLAPFHRLLALVTNPTTEVAGAERFEEPASPEFNQAFRTYCGT